LSLSLTALVVASPGWSQQLQELPTAQVGEAAGEAGDDRGEYLRIRHDADGEPIAIETSIVRFEPADDS
jgi:hypothetical protein